MSKIMLGGLCLCALGAWALGVSSCSTTAKSEQPHGAAGATAEPAKVAVARAAREELSDVLTLAAEFRPYQEVDLHAKVAGYVKEIRVDAGDRVRQGQVIATLEIPEFKTDLTQAAASKKRTESDVLRARTEVRRAKSQYDAANLTYSRLAAVSKAKPDLIAQAEIEDALAKVRIAEAQVATAEASLAVVEDQVAVQDAGIERARTFDAYTTITAPFDGVITKRFGNKGAMIQAGTASQSQAMPVVRLSQNDRLRLILPVPESAVPRIQIGRRVRVRVPSLSQSFEGRVARFSEKVEPATRTMETEVEVTNPRLVLKPGMYAYADLELDRRPDALTIPVQALARESGKVSVLVVTADKRLEKRDVTPGLETAERVEITAGLEEGALVVVGNRSQLKPGQAVETKLLDAPTTKAEAKAEAKGGQ